MKVLLRKDVRGVGRRGDVVDVKSGFARDRKSTRLNSSHT